MQRQPGTKIEARIHFLLDRLQRATALVGGLGWRIYDVCIVPVKSREQQNGDGGNSN
ncbi:MAG: hypothetical protein WKF30_00170 [Pyrinomonadaceae bacterium]